jgi:hypothetical protein
MRMARVNISLPDDLYKKARRNGLNISRVAGAALEHELEKLDKIAGLNAYLDELEAELGPSTPEEEAEADRWIEQVLAPRKTPRQKQEKRTA